ncbi:MAG: hypothetical protein Q9M92_07445 [Enterobacterales bacterium]|nr:hypothetical protein [Enterobacterales bacterium]
MSHSMQKKGKASHQKTLSTIGQKDKYMLNLFSLKGEYGLNVVEAYRIGDTCLSQTVAHLSERYKIIFYRRNESIPTRFGGVTVFARYWLDQEQCKKAREILAANKVVISSVSR